MIIAHPPCTHLAVSGARWFDLKRADGRQMEGLELFCKFLNIDCDRVAIENPINIVSGNYVAQYFPEIADRYGLPLKPTQIIQPYEYGDATKKATALWLKGLPVLKPTNVVKPEIVEYKLKNGKVARFGKGIGQAIGPDGKKYGFSDPMTAKIRSKTFEGIAEAMATQWGYGQKPNRQMSFFDMGIW